MVGENARDKCETYVPVSGNTFGGGAESVTSDQINTPVPNAMNGEAAHVLYSVDPSLEVKEWPS